MYDDDLARELTRLEGMKDTGKRAREFEVYLARRFRRERFRVMLDPKGGSDRQVDLMATANDVTYVIEAKWTADKAGVPEVRELADRLRKLPDRAIGVLISWSGFTESVAATVLDARPLQILLISGKGLKSSGSLPQSLKWKAESLLVHGDVVIDEQPERGNRAKPGALPKAPTAIVTADGKRKQWIATTGGFRPVVFVRELVDIDWVPGSGLGVCVDIQFPVLDEEALLQAIGRLHEMGWMTGQSWWSIQQADTNWHGCGTQSFVKLLTGWRRRYREIKDRHDTEEFCYVDSLDEGFYSLSGQLLANKVRATRSIGLSLQLSGVPVRARWLEELCDAFDVEDPVYYRPRSQESVTRARPDEPLDLEVIGHVVENNKYQRGRHGREWAIGVVARNPFRGKRDTPDWWPRNLEEFDQLICPLRSWHPVSKPKDSYRLWSCEWAWTSAVQAVCLLADWDDPPDEEAPHLYLDTADEPPYTVGSKT